MKKKYKKYEVIQTDNKNIMAEKTLIDEYYTGNGKLIKEDDLIYACTLNQTNLMSNKNKFYKIQYIENELGKYILFVRYGRIGERGTIVEDTYETKEEGIKKFEKTFLAKTGNKWKETRNAFVKKENKYFMTKLDMTNVLMPGTNRKIVESRLDKRVQNLMVLLSDKSLIAQAMIGLNLDMTKMPLGKISKEQINEAREILKDINNNIQRNIKGFKIAELSSEFYTRIPCSTSGRSRPITIDNTEIVSRYTNILDELEQTINTASIITEVKDTTINPIDKIYEELRTEIIPLARNSEMWDIISKYIKIAPTHKYNISIVDIYEINRNGEREKFDERTKDMRNKMLLWHGSGLSNWCSIMKNGFMLPTVLKGVQLTGWMFGAGTYFSNMFSKSMSYTRYNNFNNYACLMLSEVALGQQMKLRDARYDLNQSVIEKEGYNSVQGVGKTRTKKEYKTDRDVVIPSGDMETITEDVTLQYDEFIVYDVSQIHQRYMVVVKNN